MTVSYRPRTSENQLQALSKHAVADEIPLTEERLAILGHEIRNPLGALTASLQAWPSFGDDAQLTEQLLEIMRRQVSQLTRLCNDLLDTGRTARGSLSICRASVDVGQVIQNACEAMQPFVEQCGHTITVELGDLPLMLIGDESRLTQVFANLLHNSAKFSERHGHLHISLESDHDAAIVQLRDNGCGIRADKLRSIFFADNASQRCSEAGAKGLGIGLRLAKSIVELHGGTIEAFSEGVGHGSTFVVRLPMVSDMPADNPITSSQPIAAIRNRGPYLPQYRIVVVDDDRSLRFLMSRLLQKLGQSVTVADNGEMALDTIVQSHPDVVFLDLQMHGISGYEVARRIRGRIELNDIVLIALSGNADATSRKLAAESEFDQYLVKPTGISELTESLMRVDSLSACSGTLRKRE